MARTAEFSLMDPEVQKCPFPFYEAMRQELPIYQMPETGFYIVSRYDECVEALSKPLIFSSKGGWRPMGWPEEVLKIYNEEGFGPWVDTLISNDPPSHTHFRKLVNTAFTAARVAKMSAYVEEIVTLLIDKWVDKGTCDIVHDFTMPLPLLIIADQLGVDRSDMDKFKIWSDALIEPLGMMCSMERTIECARLTVDLQHYFAKRIEERRKEPRDDLISDLVHARVDGERSLEMPELLNIIELLLVGGNETTTNSTSLAIRHLCLHPDLFESLHGDPGLIPAYIEESLRLYTPVQGLFRKTTEAVMLGGTLIPKDSFVCIRYAAANRDETKFKCPEQVDLARDNLRSHITFSKGIHTCIGAQLARKEMEVAVREITRRTRNMRIVDGGEEFLTSIALLGLHHLPVTFEAR